MTAIDVPGRLSDRAAAPRAAHGFELSGADRRWLFIVLSGLLAARLLAMFWLPFVDTTEARYAEIARKMLETGDWITPQFDYGVPFWGKPPLHTWLSAWGMKMFGVNPFGARILILLSAMAVLGLLFGWMRRNRGGDQALLATAVLASSALFYGAAAFVMTDMAMVLGTTLCMVAFHTCTTDPRARPLWGHLFFVGIAIGLLAKGPVALVITAMPILGWLALGRRWRHARALPWRSGLLVAALLTLPWYVAAEIKTPGFLRYFLIGEHFDRFVVPGWQGDLYGSGHARPKGMIWLYGLVTFLPWTLFALALIARPRALADSLRSGTQGWYSYLVLWTLAPLVLFTPAANILAAYALPALPPAAGLLVSLWAGARGAPGRWDRRLAVAAMMTAAGLLLGISVMSRAMPQTLRLKTDRELVAAVQGIDPAIHLTVWGPRSYSAEFYTAGKADFTSDPARLSSLATNGRRDALAIPQAEVGALAPALPGFTQVGLFGRRALFVETRDTKAER